MLVSVAIFVCWIIELDYYKESVNGSFFILNIMGLRASLVPSGNSGPKILTFVIEDDSDDETIDTQDTRHDNGYDRLEDEVGLEDTHRADTNT